MEDNKIVNNSQLVNEDNTLQNEPKEMVMDTANISKEETEVNVVSNAEEVVSYKRPDFDGKILYNKEDIEYFKTIQATDIVDNCMLGDFDEKGNYVVQKHIIDAIVKMKKVYISAFEKSIYCESVKEFENYGKINLRLRIVPNTPSEGYTTAVLELLETVNKVNGYFINTNHVTLLGAQFKGEENIEKIFKFFNIVDITDGVDDGALKENNQDVLEITNRINYLLMVREGQQKFMTKYQKDLYNKKIQLLSKSKTGAPLLEDFNKEYFYVLNKFTNKDNPNFYKHLNQLLDAIIERNMDFIKEDKNLMKDLRTLQATQAKLFTIVDNQVKNEVAKQNEQKNVVSKAKEESKEVKKDKSTEKSSSSAKPAKEEKKEVKQEQENVATYDEKFEKENKNSFSAFKNEEVDDLSGYLDTNKYQRHLSNNSSVETKEEEKAM